MGYFMGIIFDLINLVPEQILHHFRFVGGESPHVVIQAGDVIAVNIAKVTHRQAAVFSRQIRMIVNAFLKSSTQSFHQSNCTIFGNNQFFPHMADNFVKQKNNRRSVDFGNIESLHRHSEYILVV